MNKPGNVALTTVLVFSALLVVSGITILITAIDFSVSASSYSNQIYAENRAISCLEESIFRKNTDLNDSGSITTDPIILDFGDTGTCQADFTINSPATTSNPNDVDISITSDYRNAEYRTTQNWNLSSSPPQEN